ncbi:S8 family peptidase [Actinoplanes cyaneus]|nr:S8 family peptidase [Actinoplanes cyaneus]MCW2139562.1 type VII secretion-associated serine protease mycosin [Actinoplanes cyaneus]
MRVSTRGRMVAGALTAAVIAGLGALALPHGSTDWQPVSHAATAHPAGVTTTWAGATTSPAGATASRAGGATTRAAFAVAGHTLAADPVTILPAEVSPARPARVVGTALDADGRPVITVREATDRATATHLVRQAQQATNALGVEVDGEVHALEAPGGSDPYRGRQWDLTTMNVPAAWQRSTGQGVTVAVIDTGVDASHPDLAGQVLTGYDAVADTGGGDTDPHGHGTHVAGTIAALTGNGIGVSGIAPDVTVLPVRVLDAKGVGYDSDTAEAIVWAADHGADVINMSLGGTARSTAVTNAVAYARGKGVVVVAAAGNERAQGSPVSYPGADPGVIAVAATDSGDVVAPYSNAGGYVDVAAPGSGILSTYPTALAASGYATMNGTSMASPHVAAAAALLLGTRPDLTPDAVESALESTAKDLGTAGKDTDYGYGRIDAAAALAAITGAPPVTPSPTVTTPPVVVAEVAVSTSVTGRSVAYGTRTSTTFKATPWAGKPASLCVSVAGGSWSCSIVRTSSTGTYTLTRVASASFRARLSVAATATNSAASATTTYTVKAVVSVSRTRSRTLTVKVTGATGQKLVVQRYVNRRWSTVKTYSATSSRKITGLVRGGAYRVVLSSNAKVLGVTSKTVKA